MMREPPIEFHLPTVSSTNDYSKELLKTYPYVFVSALHQTAGRGRSGKSWFGDYGVNAYCSLAIQHATDLSVRDLAAFMAKGSMATLQTLRAIIPTSSFRLKYPNDVQVLTHNGWSKIAGVLIEHDFLGTRCTSSVIGIGINVGQQIFPHTINQSCTSLALLGYDVDLPKLIQQLKTDLNNFNSMQSDSVMELWVRELDILGVNIRILNDPGEWVVVRVMDDGRLLLRNKVSLTERTVTDGDSIRYQD